MNFGSRILGPRLALVEDVDHQQREDRRLDAVQRGDDPGDRAHPLRMVPGKKAFVLHPDMDQDRTALEKLDLVVR